MLRPPASARALRDFLPGYNGDIGLISTIMVRECEPGVGARDTGECGQPSQSGQSSQSSHLGPGVTGREPAGQVGYRAQGRQPEAGGHLEVVVTVHCSGGQHQQYTFLQVCN